MVGPGSPGEQRAQARFGTSVRAAAFYEHQILTSLNQPMRAFIARMEMVSIATADARGHCDCSFRAGAPGFVRVLDEQTLAYPEYRGNGVLASVGNLLRTRTSAWCFWTTFRRRWDCTSTEPRRFWIPGRSRPSSTGTRTS